MKKFGYTFCLLVTLLLSGCIVPAEIFFRNKSNSIVRLQCQLINKRNFDRLPNKVNFYNFPKREKAIYGEWKKTTFLIWLDTTNFFIDVPANTIVDLEDVTDRFSLGFPIPDVLVTATMENKTDTILKGRYSDVLFTKFKEKSRFMGESTFYYDFK